MSMAMAYDDDGGLKPNNQLEEGRWMSISETSATTTAGELQTSDLEGDDDASIDLSCSVARRKTLGLITSWYWRRCSGERRTHRWGWQSHLYLYRSIELNWNEIVSWALWNCSATISGACIQIHQRWIWCHCRYICIYLLPIIVSEKISRHTLPYLLRNSIPFVFNFRRTIK